MSRITSTRVLLLAVSRPTEISIQHRWLPLPVLLGVNYTNIISPNEFSNVFDDQLAISARVELPSFAGIDSALSYTHRFYTRIRTPLSLALQQREVGQHLSKDLKVLLLKYNAYYNFNVPKRVERCPPHA